MQQSRVTGLDITAFILAWFLPLLGFILGLVGVSEAHKQGRDASGLSIWAAIIGGVATLTVIIVIIAVASSHPSPVDQFITCQQGQLNGTVPMTVDCSQYLGN